MNVFICGLKNLHWYQRQVMAVLKRRILSSEEKFKNKAFQKYPMLGLKFCKNMKQYVKLRLLYDFLVGWTKTKYSMKIDGL